MTVEWIPVTGMPTYHECSIHELPHSIGEDRYKVLLRSQADLRTLAAHPHSGSVDVEYCYARAEETAADTPASTSRIDAAEEVSAYAKANPCDAGLHADVVALAGLALLRQ